MMDAACAIERSTHVPNYAGSHAWRRTVLFTGLKTSNFGYEIARAELYRYEIWSITDTGDMTAKNANN